MSKFCPRCGTQVVDEANFCMKCGFGFNGVQAAGGTSSGAYTTVQTRQPVRQHTGPWIQNSGVVNPNPVAGYEEYNPTFHCRCEYCYYEFDYHTYDLGHRAWYPHGFVYCPRCQKPLRHKMEYEVITAVSAAPVQPSPAPVVSSELQTLQE